jgi:hypothetical protein
MVIVVCRFCATSYTLDAWAKLPPAGGGAVWDDQDAHLELRVCPCGGTVVIDLVPIAIIEE